MDISFNPAALDDFAQATSKYNTEVINNSAEIKKQMETIKSNWSGPLYETGARIDLEKIGTCLETIQDSMNTVNKLIADVSSKFNEIRY